MTKSPLIADIVDTLAAAFGGGEHLQFQHVAQAIFVNWRIGRICGSLQPLSEAAAAEFIRVSMPDSDPHHRELTLSYVGPFIAQVIGQEMEDEDLVESDGQLIEHHLDPAAHEFLEQLQAKQDATGWSPGDDDYDEDDDDEDDYGLLMYDDPDE
jgi:hypothetical protein